MSQTGVVKTWKVNRGFGFIAPDDGGPDIFAHVKNIDDSERNHLKIGEKVTFSVYTDDRSGKERASRIKGDGSGATPYEEDGRYGGGDRRGGGRRDDRRGGGRRDDRRGGRDRERDDYRRGGRDRDDDRRGGRDDRRGGRDRDDDRRGGRDRDEDRRGGRDRDDDRDSRDNRSKADDFGRDRRQQRTFSPADDRF